MEISSLDGGFHAGPDTCKNARWIRPGVSADHPWASPLVAQRQTFLLSPTCDRATLEQPVGQRLTNLARREAHHVLCHPQQNRLADVRTERRIECPEEPGRRNQHHLAVAPPAVGMPSGTTLARRRIAGQPSPSATCEPRLHAVPPQRGRVRAAVARAPAHGREYAPPDRRSPRIRSCAQRAC